MTCADVYSLVFAYLNEDEQLSDTADMRRRMPPLLAAVTAELTALDRAVSGCEDKVYPPFSELACASSVFPLCDTLAVLCALRTASVLICDENEALSARLMNEYRACLKSVTDMLPADIGRITDVYG